MKQVPGLYIIENKEKSRGVYTSIKINEGDLIEIAPVIVIPKSELPIIHKSVIHDYYFLWGEDLESCAIALGYGSLYNHATYPNATFELDLDNLTVDIYAIKSIEPGEEITINYHGEVGCKDELWFEER